MNTRGVFPNGTYFADYLFRGPELEPSFNVLVHVHNGLITSIEPDQQPSRADFLFHSHLTGDYQKTKTILFPQFINGHVHSLDFFIAGLGWDKSLKSLVGAKGLKNIAIQSQDPNRLIRVSRDYLKLLALLGYNQVLDFREGGLLGVRSGRLASQGLGLSHFIFGRVNNVNPNTLDSLFLEEVQEVIRFSDGLGIPDLKRWGKENMIAASELARTQNKLVAIHVSESKHDKDKLREQGIHDISFVLDTLKADILIHVTHVTQDELRQLHDEASKRVYVLCPKANTFFLAGEPPLEYFIKEGIPFLLGTDNSFTMHSSMLEEIRFTLLQKKKKQALPPRKLLQAATGNLLPSKFKSFRNVLEVGEPFTPQVFSVPFPLKARIHSFFAFHVSDMFRNGEWIRTRPRET